MDLGLKKKPLGKIKKTSKNSVSNGRRKLPEKTNNNKETHKNVFKMKQVIPFNLSRRDVFFYAVCSVKNKNSL